MPGLPDPSPTRACGHDPQGPGASSQATRARSRLEAPSTATRPNHFGVGRCPYVDLSVRSVEVSVHHCRDQMLNVHNVAECLGQIVARVSDSRPSLMEANVVNSERRNSPCQKLGHPHARPGTTAASSGRSCPSNPSTSGPYAPACSTKAASATSPDSTPLSTASCNKGGAGLQTYGQSAGLPTPARSHKTGEHRPVSRRRPRRRPGPGGANRLVSKAAEAQRRRDRLRKRLAAPARWYRSVGIREILRRRGHGKIDERLRACVLNPMNFARWGAYDVSSAQGRRVIIRQ